MPERRTNREVENDKAIGRPILETWSRQRILAAPCRKNQPLAQLRVSERRSGP